jgi:hypothetical protein
MLEKILRLIVGRATVTNRVIQAAIGKLEEVLVMRGFHEIERIPHAVRLVIVHEALRKAAEKEPDNIARMGVFLDQVELVAGSVIEVFNGDENADPRIKNILIFHKVLVGPNACSCNESQAEDSEKGSGCGGVLPKSPS